MSQGQLFTLFTSLLLMLLGWWHKAEIFAWWRRIGIRADITSAEHTRCGKAINVAQEPVESFEHEPSCTLWLGLRARNKSTSSTSLESFECVIGGCSLPFKHILYQGKSIKLPVDLQAESSRDYIVSFAIDPPVAPEAVLKGTITLKHTFGAMPKLSVTAHRSSSCRDDFLFAVAAGRSRSR